MAARRMIVSHFGDYRIPAIGCRKALFYYESIMEIERGSEVRVIGEDKTMSADYFIDGEWICHWFDGKEWTREKHPPEKLEIIDNG
jgi:uncharacterized protein YodC (DUF2158 family)